MTDRIVDISEGPASLSARDGLLVIGRGGEEQTVPMADLAVLILAHRAVRLTGAVLSGVCRAGGMVVACDSRSMPAGMVMPLEGNFVQTERFAAQAAASLPTKKRIWKSIVRAKVGAQGDLLEAARGSDMGLSSLSSRVRSGDPSNVEAQASRRYWRALFGDGFRRDPEGEDHNRLLNYGYAVLRAITARAICGAGLHPSLGVHHKNRYNAFCLADDLMEPCRPVVDRVVAGLVEERGASAPLDRAAKAAIVGGILGRRLTMEGESRTIFNALSAAAASLVSVFEGGRRDIVLPEA